MANFKKGILENGVCCKQEGTNTFPKNKYFKYIWKSNENETIFPANVNFIIFVVHDQDRQHSLWSIQLFAGVAKYCYVLELI